MTNRIMVAALACAAGGSSFAQIERAIRPVPSGSEVWGITDAPAAGGPGGFATVGSGTANGQLQIVFTRHQAGGIPVVQRYLSAGRNDIAFCIQNTRDGGFIIAGETDAIDPNQGYITLTRTDASGAVIWSRAMPGTTFNDRPISVGLRETSSGDYLIVARARIPGQAGQFAAAALFTPAGVPLWANMYRDPRYQLPVTRFADVREVSFAGGANRYVVVGLSARDAASPREAIAAILDPATGNNIFARSYDFFNPDEDSFASGLLIVNPTSYRVTGRITDPNSNLVRDDTFVLDIDAGLTPVGLAAVYDDFKVAHAAIEPAFTGAGVSTLAGHFVTPNGVEDAMLMSLSATPLAFIGANIYGGERPDFFRGLITSSSGIVTAGLTNSFGVGDWHYVVTTDLFGRDGCERRKEVQRITSQPRSASFEMPRITWPVREYRLGDPRNEWFDRVVCKQCPVDFNNDGFVDFFDYDDYVTCFETGVCPPGKDADYNGDGFVDFFDYDDFVTAFERGC